VRHIKNKDRRLSLFLPALEEAKLEDLWFQQDGTTAHIDGFNELFERKLLRAAHLPQGGPTGQRAPRI
jgi:hypothetical protein